jgi:hypothetical protein
MGTKRAFRSSIGFSVRDVSSTIGDLAAAAGLRVRPSTEVRGLWLRTEVDGSVRRCASPIAFGLASIRSLPAATSVVVIREQHAIGCLCLRRARQLRRQEITARWSSDASSSLGVAVTKVAFGSPALRAVPLWSELASDSWCGQRRGGNAFEQLER